MTPAQDPFAALAALAAEELALVTDGRYEDLPELAARRAPVLAALPASPPPTSLPHLREALRLQALVTEALTQSRAAVGAEIAGLRRRRAGARGYGAGQQRRVAFDATT